MKPIILAARDGMQLLLVALRDETYERVRELRHEQEEDTELAPADETRWTARAPAPTSRLMRA
jgi:hypothetical protein